MDPTIPIAAALGALATWAISKYFYDKKRRQYLRDTTEQMKQSGKIQDRHYSLTVSVYRSALEKLEAGDIEGAKRDLSDSVASFYHIKSKGRRELASLGISPEKPDWTGDELLAIENNAKRFESLRAALGRKQNAPAA